MYHLPPPKTKMLVSLWKHYIPCGYESVNCGPATVSSSLGTIQAVLSSFKHTDGIY